jgi:hypothetical protein
MIPLKDTISTYQQYDRTATVYYKQSNPQDAVSEKYSVVYEDKSGFRLREDFVSIEQAEASAEDYVLNVSNK